MTRERMYGSDTEFCAWMRACPELPSYGKNFGFVASDNDVTVHRYLSVVDGIGTRELQGIMQIEVKTRTGKPSSSQVDTLSKLNAFQGDRKVRGELVRYYGVFLLVMQGTSPDNSRKMWWGVLPKDDFVSDARKAKWFSISRLRLIGLLRFDLHPRNLQLQPARRHHKTRELLIQERSPLGFMYLRKLMQRS